MRDGKTAALNFRREVKLKNYMLVLVLVTAILASLFVGGTLVIA